MQILFILRKLEPVSSKSDKRLAIYCRITIDGKRAVFSTQLKIAAKHWNQKAQAITLRNEEARQDNETLRFIRASLKEIYNRLLRERKRITAQIIKNTYIQKEKPIPTFLDCFQSLIKRLAKEGVASSTVQTYRYKYQNTERYLQEQKKLKILPDEFTPAMADNFVFWLKTEKECNHNHSIKHLQLVKQVLRFAIKQELIQKNPLQHYGSPLEKYSAPVTLSIEELERIGSHPFDKPYLSRVADLLIFQAYTGFAYVDLQTFNPEKHMHVGSDGTNWIRKERQKSSELALLPLFPKAKQIIEKYDHKLPLISNQKYNEYLKEVAQLVGITKHLTTHTFRKTAAQIWIDAGISAETVARMMGHANSKMTLSRYANVSEKRIYEEISKKLSFL